MGSIHRLYVDTNVFVRLFEGADATTEALAELFVAERAAASPFLVTSELTLAELLVQPYRNQNESLIRTYDNWTVSNEQLEVAPVERQVLWYAAVLRAQFPNLKLPDAIHLSTAIGTNCSHFLTADNRFAESYDLYHGRFGVKRGPVRVNVLRLELDVLQLINAGAL